MNNSTRPIASVLWLLLFLFILRVIGQMFVAAGWQGFLPPMEEWYSGLISYPWLVVSQIVIIILYGKVRADAAFPALTIGAPVYASITAGAVQTAQPSGVDDVIRIVGYGNTADEMFFCLQKIRQFLFKILYPIFANHFHSRLNNLVRLLYTYAFCHGDQGHL